MIAVQVFDQKKFKRKDQGFLGVINVQVSSVFDLEVGGDGKERKKKKKTCFFSFKSQFILTGFIRNADTRVKEIQCE